MIFDVTNGPKRQNSTDSAITTPAKSRKCGKIQPRIAMLTFLAHYQDPKMPSTGSEIQNNSESDDETTLTTDKTLDDSDN